jgi:hypothetical protein
VDRSDGLEQTVEFQESFSEGIGIYNTKALRSGMRPSRELTENGIGVWSSMLSTVVDNNNDRGDFTVDPKGCVQNYLVPSTT